jgi:hypothetical protein
MMSQFVKLDKHPHHKSPITGHKWLSANIHYGIKIPGMPDALVSIEVISPNVLLNQHSMQRTDLLLVEKC